MRKYVALDGFNKLLLIEDEKYSAIGYLNSGVDWMFMIPADGELITPEGVKQVKENDIVILFYKTNYDKHDIIVIDNPEWKENIKSRLQYENEERSKICENYDKCNNCEDPCCASYCKD